MRARRLPPFTVRATIRIVTSCGSTAGIERIVVAHFGPLLEPAQPPSRTLDMCWRARRPVAPSARSGNSVGSSVGVGGVHPADPGLGSGGPLTSHWAGSMRAGA